MGQADDLETLVLNLYEIGAVRFGNFVLPGGRQSPIYIDLRLLASFPDALRQAATVYRLQLEKLTFDLLAAPPLAGLPIGTAICLDMNMPLIYPRQILRGYGTSHQIEGKWEVGQRAVVIDDLISSGDSVLRGIAFLKAAGLRVTDAVVLIDQEQGGREAIKAQGYNLHSALSLSRLLAILESKELITAKQQSKVIKKLKL